MLNAFFTYIKAIHNIVLRIQLHEIRILHLKNPKYVTSMLSRYILKKNLKNNFFARLKKPKYLTSNDKKR